jgi:hypothetical protein
VHWASVLAEVRIIPSKEEHPEAYDAPWSARGMAGARQWSGGLDLDPIDGAMPGQLAPQTPGGEGAGDASPLPVAPSGLMYSALTTTSSRILSSDTKETTPPSLSASVERDAAASRATGGGQWSSLMDTTSEDGPPTLDDERCEGAGGKWASLAVSVGTTGPVQLAGVTVTAASPALAGLWGGGGESASSSDEEHAAPTPTLSSKQPTTRKEGDGRKWRLRKSYPSGGSSVGGRLKRKRRRTEAEAAEFNWSGAEVGQPVLQVLRGEEEWFCDECDASSDMLDPRYECRRCEWQYWACPRCSSSGRHPHRLVLIP